MTNPPPRQTRTATVLLGIVSIFILTTSPADATVLPSQQRCQKSISKAARSYVAGVVKHGTKCRLTELADGTSGACEDPKTLARLSKEAAKFDRKLRKGCAGISAEELSTARPFGLGFAADLDEMIANQQARYAELAQAVLDDLYAPSTSNATPSGRATLKCQKALDKAAAAQLKNVFQAVGSKCRDRENRGKDVAISRYRLTTACLALAQDDLEERALRLVEKSAKSCGAAFPAKLAVCGAPAGSFRTPEEAQACLAKRATAVGTAVIESEHANSHLEMIGTLQTSGDRSMAVPEATIQLRNSEGEVVSSATTNARGGFRLEGVRFRDYTICWSGGRVASCSDTPIEIGRYESGSVIKLPPPLDLGESALRGRLLRQDGSPCFDMGHAPAMTTRGQVRSVDSEGVPQGVPTAISSSGEFLLIADNDTAAVLAECGLDSRVVSRDEFDNITIVFDNAAPVGESITIADLDGRPIVDVTSLKAGDVVILTANFEDEDPLTYDWQVTRGGGALTPFGDGPTDKATHASQKKWTLGRNTLIQQIQVTASDAHAGTTTLLAQTGPFQLPSEISPLPWDPCDFLFRYSTDLCGQGYTSDDNSDGVNDVPEPVGGRENFLTVKFGNNPVDNDASACLYYNIIDPDCVDLDCDGVIDPGTNSSGACKRMTLGGWWEKNGFDPVDGLGTGEVDAWYLNSNDLGFGREMHCRVTSYSFPLRALLQKEMRSRGDTAEPRRSSHGELDASALYLALASPWADPVALKILSPRWPSTIACYVANYTTDFCNNYPTNNPTNADLAYQGQLAIEANPTQNPLHAYGTVAMEFSPIEGFGEQGSLTKFYVYDGRTADSGRLYSANLDGCGQKSVPELCMACHGGIFGGSGTQISGFGLTGIYPFDGTSPADLQAFQTRKDLIEPMTPGNFGFSSFLPFDPDTYQFPSISGANQAAQHDSLRALNRLVRYTEPKDAIIELTKGFYGNNFSSGTFANFIPPSSTMDPTLYTDVYATACRGCHAATYDVIPTPSRICVDAVSGEGGEYAPTMPHAKLTYLNFWRSDFPQSAPQTHMDGLVVGGTCRTP